MKGPQLHKHPEYRLLKQNDAVSFFRMQMPQWLFCDPKYASLSLESKVAYTFLHKLSAGDSITYRTALGEREYTVLLDTIFAAVNVKLALIEVSEQVYIADQQAKAAEYASAKNELDTKLKKLRLAQTAALEEYLEGKPQKSEFRERFYCSIRITVFPNMMTGYSRSETPENFV